MTETGLCTVCRRSQLFDDGDELVCPSCGAVKQKVVMQVRTTPSDNDIAPLGTVMRRDERQALQHHLQVDASRTVYTESTLNELKAKVFFDTARNSFRLSHATTNQAMVNFRILVKQRPAFEDGRHVVAPGLWVYALVAAAKQQSTFLNWKAVIKLANDKGHRIKPRHLWLLQSKYPLTKDLVDVEGLIKRCVAFLERGKFLPSFETRNVVQTALGIFDQLGQSAEGHSRLTVAAACVYVAARNLGYAGRGRRKQHQVTQGRCGLAVGAAEYTVREFVGGEAKLALAQA